MLGRELPRELERAVLRAVVDDHPGPRQLGLRSKARGEARQILRLVTDRRDDRVCPHRQTTILSRAAVSVASARGRYSASQTSSIRIESSA